MTNTSCLLHPADTPGWPATCPECRKHDAEHVAKFRPDLDERADDLEDAGLSTRAIASVVGVSNYTASKDIQAGVRDLTPEPDEDPQAGGTYVPPEPEPDDRPVCRSCPRRLGKSEAEAGQCLPCQRIAAAQERAGVTS